jgi:hypothetical protein
MLPEPISRQLAESVGQMADLISFSNESALGPLGR